MRVVNHFDSHCLHTLYLLWFLLIYLATPTCLSDIQHLSNKTAENGGWGKLYFPKMAAIPLAHTFFHNITLPCTIKKQKIIPLPPVLGRLYDLPVTNTMWWKWGSAPSKAVSEKAMHLLPLLLGWASHHVRSLTTLTPPCWRGHVRVLWWPAQVKFILWAIFTKTPGIWRSHLRYSIAAYLSAE